MKTVYAVVAAAVALAAPAFAEGDAAKGEKEFKKCKSCHTIVSPEGEVVFKGGKPARTSTALLVPWLARKTSNTVTA